MHSLVLCLFLGKNMNLSVKGESAGSKKLSAEATLNPNAAEFVPISLRSQAESFKTLDTSSKFATSGKSVLDRSESSASNNSSEDDALQYWRHQLPDDITPDYNVMRMDNEINSLPFSNLSLNEVHGASKYTSPSHNGLTLKESQAFSSYGECFQTSPAKPWDKQIGSSDQLLSRERNPVLSENTDMRSLEFLALQFPGFAAESIAEVYFSYGGNINQTIERLTQLEIQVDGRLNHAHSPTAFSTQNRSALNLPALRVPDGRSGLGKFAVDDQQNVSPHWSSMKDISLPSRSFPFIPSRGSIDFASAAKKISSSQASSIWKYNRNSSSDARQILASSYNSGQAKSIYVGLQSRGSPLASPVRTGESFVNPYSEKREEARDHAHLHNLQMKAAYVKAHESIHRQRNSVIQTDGREQMIDLHGLNMIEAIFVLKRELAIVRNAARSVDQRLLLYIFVGLGHHMPAAVQRCLLEEGLDYSEPQPGLLRVMIY